MSKRVDDSGAAYAGSQLQTQLYVNARTAQLDDAIRAEFPALAAAQLEWRSPLAEDGFREYWDRAFLERVDLGGHAAELRAFWPSGGPHWDALAVVRRPNDTRPGVLLVEGKSYPDEFFGSRGRRTRSASPAARRRIGVDGSIRARTDWRTCAGYARSSRTLIENSLRLPGDARLAAGVDGAGHVLIALGK